MIKELVILLFFFIALFFPLVTYAEVGPPPAAPGTFEIILHPNVPNSYVVNKVTAEIIGGDNAAGAGIGDFDPASTDACGNKYKLNNPMNKNFGDPLCNFNKDELYQLLEKQDPQQVVTWFFRIIPCESGYNPNAYAGPQTGTPDAGGAWGLYQMGSSTPPGQAPPAPGKGGPNDRGDVNWSIQTSNAVSRGKQIGDLKRYWEGARGPKSCWLQ